MEDSIASRIRESLTHPSLVLSASLIICVGWVTWLVLCSKSAGLSQVPGPFLARYTNAWGLYQAWKVAKTGQKGKFHRRLQEQYGDVVRVGPSSIIVMDPDAVPIIYSVRARLDKGPAYIPFRQPGVTTSLLSISSETTHSQYRKLVSNAYSMSSLKGYEPYVDEMIDRFMQVCDTYARSGEPMNISRWTHFYCFDVVSKLTTGTALGFMDGGGHDAFGLIQRIKEFGAYVAPVAQMPWLHKVFQDNIVFRRTKPSPFMAAIRSKVNERIQKPDPEDMPRPDLLSHFVAAHKDKPLMDVKQVMISTSGNLIAGGLSPSSTFDCLCQYLATHPESQDLLYAELKNANLATPARFDDVKDLPYLEGVIKEAYRLHNTASFNLQRVTGPEGLQLPKVPYSIPPGTMIGCPAESINKDARIFGPDAIEYRPERWMRQKGESDDEFHTRRKVWDKTDLTFGQGSRTCIGKNIVHLEIFKVVATLMLAFKFELVGQAKKGVVLAHVVPRTRKS